MSAPKEIAIRRQLIKLHAATGEERFLRAAELLHDEADTDFLTAALKAQPGRPEFKDRHLMNEMHRLLSTGEAKSVRQAAAVLEPLAKGASSEARVDRLRKAYSKARPLLIAMQEFIHELTEGARATRSAAEWARRKLGEKTKFN